MARRLTQQPCLQLPGSAGLPPTEVAVSLQARADMSKSSNSCFSLLKSAIGKPRTSDLLGRSLEGSPRLIVIRREGQPDSVLADIFRPPANEIAETSTVVGEERARRLLESRKVAGDGKDKPVRRLL